MKKQFKYNKLIKDNSKPICKITHLEYFNVLNVLSLRTTIYKEFSKLKFIIMIKNEGFLLMEWVDNKKTLL